MPTQNLLAVTPIRGRKRKTSSPSREDGELESPRANSISVGPGRRKAAAAWSAQVLRVERAQLRAQRFRAEWLRPEQHCRMAMKEQWAKPVALMGRRPEP